MRSKLLLACFLLSSCAAPTPPEVTMGGPADPVDSLLPAVQVFAPEPAAPPSRSNAQIAADILELQFRMESGRTLPRLSRFEGPITVAMTGNVPATAAGDLTRLMGRFRAEAGLDIRPAGAGDVASVTIDFHPRHTLQRAVPTAACFVVPNVSSLDEYRAKRGTAAVDWANLRERNRVAIFVPSDTSPQEVRDCLHEELAQAMGPLNDLHRLQDSVFNDDNFHTVLTGFDMLVLRAHYAPELQSGMTEGQVAARLPAILARLNPAGGAGGIATASITPRSWIDAVGAALGPRDGASARREAALRMLSIAHAQGWTDTRLAFSHFAVGRTNVDHDLPTAIRHFSEAGRIWRAMPGGAIHAAHVDMQLAAFALATGDYGKTLAFTERAIPVVRAAQNASLLATLQVMRSEALAATGQADAARQARLDSLGWARYGFGSDAEVRGRLRDIAALAARGNRG